MRDTPNVERAKTSALLLKVSFEDPKLVYDFIKHDVLEAISNGDREKFGKALPYQLLEMRFQNKNEISDEEIEGVFNAYFAAEDKTLYRFWLKVVMSANQDLSKQLFRRRLGIISKEDEMDDFLQNESWVDRLSLFNDHELIKSILSSAKEISSKCLKTTIQRLAHVSTNIVRSYSNGELKDQSILEKALEYREQVRDDELLYQFYDAVVKTEREDMERHREEYKRQMLAMDDF
jgi:hypothetical protein